MKASVQGDYDKDAWAREWSFENSELPNAEQLTFLRSTRAAVYDSISTNAERLTFLRSTRAAVYDSISTREMKREGQWFCIRQHNSAVGTRRDLPTRKIL